MKEVRCAYCGRLLVIRSDNHRDHVFPDCLYASTDPSSKIQRLTIDCCQPCNASWSDDEVQFRNMLLVAGDNPTQERRDLWNSTAMRSFQEKDGKRRLDELFIQMKAVETSDGTRHVVYPAKDARVMRIIKKIVRGLSHHHNIRSAVPDDQVFADIVRFPVPNDILADMQYSHRDPTVVEYRYRTPDQGDIESIWLITFFNSVRFIGGVSRAVTPAA